MDLKATARRGLFALLLAALGSVAAAAQLSADQILEKSRDRLNGNEVYSEVKLILFESDKSTRERKLIYLQKDYGKEEKLTLYFTGPADVKGVGLQSNVFDEASGKDDEQWIYLPAFRQIRRIASGDKRGAFMGSQFAYIDLDKLRVKDYRQTIIGEEKAAGKDCYVIERLPVSDSVIDKTGYYKVRVWVDKETFVVLRQTYYNAAGVLFKEMNVKRVEKIQNLWTVMDSVMDDHVNRRSSQIVFDNVHYNTGLNDALFQQAILKTGVNSGNLPAFR